MKKRKGMSRKDAKNRKVDSINSEVNALGGWHDWNIEGGQIEGLSRSFTVHFSPRIPLELQNSLLYVFADSFPKERRKVPGANRVKWTVETDKGSFGFSVLLDTKPDAFAMTLEEWKRFR